jgi:hypothetical protein
VRPGYFDKKWLALFACALFASTQIISFSVAAANEEESAQALLHKADQIRFPRESFQVDVGIKSTGPDKEPDIRRYRILAKGNENTVIMIIEPAAERGQMMLMKARDLWVFLPSVSQPVRLSLGQRLTGQVANGDLARSNFTGDYTPKVLRTDVIDADKYTVLELTAVDRSVTYSKVIYWVNEANSRPYRAEFYSLSNRLLKTCRYENYQLQLGIMRPTRLVMEDALKKGEESVLEYSAMQLRDLPDKIFTKDYLNKLQ